MRRLFHVHANFLAIVLRPAGSVGLRHRRVPVFSIKPVHRQSSFELVAGAPGSKDDCRAAAAPPFGRLRLHAEHRFSRTFKGASSADAHYADHGVHILWHVIRHALAYWWWNSGLTAMTAGNGQWSAGLHAALGEHDRESKRLQINRPPDEPARWLTMSRLATISPQRPLDSIPRAGVSRI
jgi:hypothetical protein